MVLVPRRLSEVTSALSSSGQVPDLFMLEAVNHQAELSAVGWWNPKIPGYESPEPKEMASNLAQNAVYMALWP